MIHFHFSFPFENKVFESHTLMSLLWKRKTKIINNKATYHRPRRHGDNIFMSSQHHVRPFDRLASLNWNICMFHFINATYAHALTYSGLKSFLLPISICMTKDSKQIKTCALVFYCNGSKLSRIQFFQRFDYVL